MYWHISIQFWVSKTDQHVQWNQLMNKFLIVLQNIWKPTSSISNCPKHFSVNRKSLFVPTVALMWKYPKKQPLKVQKHSFIFICCCVICWNSFRANISRLSKSYEERKNCVKKKKIKNSFEYLCDWNLKMNSSWKKK